MTENPMTAKTIPEALAIERARGDEYRAEIRAEGFRAGAEAMREAAAKLADEYAAVNIQAASDTILHDPILSGGTITPASIAKANDLMVQGCVHSAMFHAAQNIAGAVRSLDIPEDRT